MSPSDPTPHATGPWKTTQPSFEVVQKHYVSARVHELNSTMTDRYREETINELMKALAGQIKGGNKRKTCADVYDLMTKFLQSRNLTINLKAASWFSKENPYETYSQMYERAVDPNTGAMFLTDADPLNPANVRAAADDRITFPQHWTNPAAPARRGLSPGTQSTQAITSRMLTGQAIPAFGPPNNKYLNKATKPDGSDAWTSKNPKFNPKTKQVFTALNYGKRPHGSSTQYGMSHFILNPNLKVDAIYFPGDTFFIPSADHQATYQTLGGLYLHAKPNLRALLLNCCLTGAQLPDTGEASELVEAHLFQQLRFANCIKDLVLEPTTDDNIVANATKFCNKWGIRLIRT